MTPPARRQAVHAPIRPGRAAGQGAARRGGTLAGLAALALLAGGCDKIRKAMEYHPEARSDSAAVAAPTAAPGGERSPDAAASPPTPAARVRQWSPSELATRLRQAWIRAGGQELQLVDGRARGRHGMTTVVDEDGSLRQPAFHDFDADGLLDIVVLVRTATGDGQSLGAALFLNQDGYLHHVQTLAIEDGAFDSLFVEDGRLVMRFSDPEAGGAPRLRRFETLGQTLSEIP